MPTRFWLSVSPARALDLAQLDALPVYAGRELVAIVEELTFAGGLAGVNVFGRARPPQPGDETLPGGIQAGAMDLPAGIAPARRPLGFPPPRPRRASAFWLG